MDFLKTVVLELIRYAIAPALLVYLTAIINSRRKGDKPEQQKKECRKRKDR